VVTRIALALAVVARVASAQPESDMPDTERAKLHYKQGKAFLDHKLYDDAIREFNAAYQIAPVPELLFNIAQADRLKGDSQKAIAMYQKYVDQAPYGPGADEARAHIAALTKALREPPPPPKPTWHDDDDDTKIAPPPVAPAPAPQPEPEPVDDVASHRRALGRYAIYGGAGLEVVGGVFLYLGSNLNDRLRGQVAMTAENLRYAQSLGTVYNWTAGLSMVLGAAGIATGITLIVRNHDSDVHVGATASNGFTGLVVSGHL
jgi:tetratricopeptide (TPR) repeat protein